jgi:pyruvate dehydrogenase E1 component alpha subunit
MVTYRTQEELDRFKLRDPILSVRAYGVQHGLATPDEFEAIDARVQRDLDTAWGDAKTAPWPAPEEALTDVYVTY